MEKHIQKLEKSKVKRKSSQKKSKIIQKTKGRRVSETEKTGPKSLTTKTPVRQLYPTPQRARASETKSLLITNVASTSALMPPNSRKLIIKPPSDQKALISTPKPLNERSFCLTAKKSTPCPQRLGSKSAHKNNSALNNTESNTIKLTPRYAHPQSSHQTPDSCRLAKRLHPPTLTAKKSKVPGLGACFKRLAFGKKHKLYSPATTAASSTNPCPFLLGPDSDLSGIAKTPQTESAVTEAGDAAVKSQETIFQSTDSQTALPVVTETVFTEESYASPVRLIKVYSSPEKVMLGRSPESVRRKRTSGWEMESPGSFELSLSSDWEEENTSNCVKDMAIQTDILEINDDAQVAEGLKLIGRLSEIVVRNKLD
jgi:hypothetical protein